MSNIYIQEPPALGKILLKTTVGDIDIELWTKEAPKACRNFIQLCMEGYYNETIFHRVVPDFIVQGGDPNGDGTGGESIYGATFKDEFHTRLRFNRRGLVAMANAGKDDNGSQFFFTLNSTPELQNKHTIFAKVTGETIYNMLKLAEGDIDENERPEYPHKIISCEILVNPFEDIVPRIAEKPAEEVVEKKKKKEKGVKNFGLLSFGMEAEEDEDQSIEYRGKPKSTHDLLDDPKLSKLTAIDMDSEEKKIDEEEKHSSDLGPDAIANIRNKLQAKNKDVKNPDEIVEKEEEIEEYYLGKDKKEARKKQFLEIKEQIKELKREMSGKKNVVENPDTEKDIEKVVPTKPMNDMMEDYESEQEKYKKKMDELPKKGVSREQFTLALLSKFQKKLSSAKEKHESEEVAEDKEQSDSEDINSDNWLTHKLHFESKGEVLAKDASTKGDDWYDIYDPRNPINKRKREVGKDGPSSKSKKGA